VGAIDPEQTRGIPSIGTLYKKVFHWYGTHWKRFTGISFSGIALSWVLIACTVFLWNGVGGGTPVVRGEVPGVFLGTFILLLIINFWWQGALFLAITRDVSVSVAFRDAVSFILPFAVLLVISGLAVVGAGIMLVIPAFVVWIYYVFASPLLFIERKGVHSALTTSMQYVGGGFWVIFLRIIAIVIPVVAVAGFSQFVFTFFDISVSLIVSTLLEIVIIPIAMLYISMLALYAKQAFYARPEEERLSQAIAQRILYGLVILGILVVMALAMV